MFGNGMGMGIRPKLGNRNGKEWEATVWEWEGIGILKNQFWPSLFYSFGGGVAHNKRC